MKSKIAWIAMGCLLISPVLFAQTAESPRDELMTQRMTDNSLARNIDNYVSDLEYSLAYILGIPMDTPITQPVFSVDANGNLTFARTASPHFDIVEGGSTDYRLQVTAANGFQILGPDGTTVLASLASSGFSVVPDVTIGNLNVTGTGTFSGSLVATGAVTLDALHVTGSATFDQPVTIPDPVADTDAANKEYVSAAMAAAGNVANFTDLLDTPGGYSGYAGKAVIVKSDESGLTFGDAAAAGASTYLDLTDTPSSYSGADSQFVQVAADGSGLLFGIPTFLGLSDTPSAYTANDYFVVNSSGDAVIQHAPLTFLDLPDTPASYTANDLVSVNSGGTALTFTAPPAVYSTFKSLSDTPGSINADQWLQGNYNGTAVQFSTINFLDLEDTPAAYGSIGQVVELTSSNQLGFASLPPAGSTTFTGLTDTPGSFSSAASKYVTVNSGGTALEFTVLPVATFAGLPDGPGTFSGSSFRLVEVNSDETGLIYGPKSSTAGWNAGQLEGNPISSTAPATGQYLKWDGSNWDPADLPTVPSGTAIYTIAAMPKDASSKTVSTSITVGGAVETPTNCPAADVSSITISWSGSDITVTRGNVTSGTSCTCSVIAIAQ